MEDAYRVGESIGLSGWCEDEAGPFQTVPYAGASWQADGAPERQPHAYVRNGTAKCLTRLHPASGQVRVNGVPHGPNTIWHAWLRTERSTLGAALPAPCMPRAPATTRVLWDRWQVGLTAPVPLPNALPPLRMRLLLDKRKGHQPPAFVPWLIAPGIMPLYTPLGGAWLNMAESIQRSLTQRALAGQHPTTTDEISAWLEAVAEAWNRDPTPCEGGGTRAVRRARRRARRHGQGGSGACTRRPVLRRRRTKLDEWQRTHHVTH